MLDHYTTGLQTQSILQIIYFNVAMRLVFFAFECFADAVAFLADAVVAVASAKRVHDGVEVLGVPRGAEHFFGVLVAVVAVAVAAVFACLVPS